MRPAETTSNEEIVRIIRRGNWGCRWAERGKGATCGGREPEGRACGGGRPGRRHSCRGARSSSAGAARASRSPIVARRRRKGEEVLEGGRWKCWRRRRSCECAWMAWALFGSAAYEARGAGFEPHGKMEPAGACGGAGLLASVRSGLEPNRTQIISQSVWRDSATPCRSARPCVRALRLRTMVKRRMGSCGGESVAGDYCLSPR
jgi:hypothetical protein